ncbi:unnamed protein product [Ilex paraguariensis]|uniref:Uncharacterized protein n=1 Tax=Ilex paraguariensis TaxID=185542 RepID=A0ABC8RWE5_9AQUA
MTGAETKKQKKVTSRGSSGNAKLFLDKDAKKRYDTFIVKCLLLIERGVYLDELVGSVDCPEILRRRKWETLFDVSVEDKTYVYLVKIFYANVHEYKENELTFNSLVRKISITILPDLISNILKIDRPDIPENAIVFPYSSKEQVPDMMTVIRGGILLSLDTIRHNYYMLLVNMSFMYPMNAMGMGTFNKSVEAILGVKRVKRVKQPSVVSQVVSSQAGASQGGSDVGTSEGGQTLQQMVEKLEARFEKFEDEMKGSLQRLESKLDCFYKVINESINK